MTPKNGLQGFAEVLEILHMNASLPLPEAPDPELLELSFAEAERMTREFFERQDREAEEAQRREAAELSLAI